MKKILIIKIYEYFPQVYKENNNNTYRKMDKEVNREFNKREIKMTKNILNDAQS